MITTDINKVIYVSDGTTTEYDFSFMVYDKSHLKVYIQSPNSNKPAVLEEANYSVVLNEDYSGGKIILNQPLPQNTKISIIREINKTQEIHYIEGSPFPAQSHERALDKLTMITQQLDEKISRIPQGNVFDSGIDFDDLYNSIQYCSNNIEALAKSISMTVNTIKDLIAIDTANLTDKTAVLVLGYHEPNDGGGGIFYWDTQQDKSNHNGGTIIDPTAIFPTDWIDTTQQNTWFSSSNTGNGCWMRILYKGYIAPEKFGAVGDGVTDDYFSVQYALNLLKSIMLLKKYYISKSISLPLTNGNAIDVYIKGSGKEKCGLVIADGIDGIIDTGSTYTRVSFSDFSITGSSSSKKGIYLTGLVYESSFDNLNIHTGDDAIRLPKHFNVHFTQCHVNSYNGHGFHLNGGNSTILINCYAHNFGSSDKAGYRIYSEATLISCTGIDSGSYWGIFGATSSEDGINAIATITMINCHAEDFTEKAIRFKYNAQVNLIRCDFLAPATGSFYSHIHVDYSDQLIRLDNCSFGSKGATRTALANVSASGGANVVGVDSVDINGTLYKATAESFSYSYLNRKLSYNYLHIGEAYIDSVNSSIKFTGNITTSNLPTSDPHVAGQLWVDTANGYVVKVSQG